MDPDYLDCATLLFSVFLSVIFRGVVRINQHVNSNYGPTSPDVQSAKKTILKVCKMAVRNRVLNWRCVEFLVAVLWFYYEVWPRTFCNSKINTHIISQRSVIGCVLGRWHFLRRILLGNYVGIIVTGRPWQSLVFDFPTSSFNFQVCLLFLGIYVFAITVIYCSRISILHNKFWIGVEFLLPRLTNRPILRQINPDMPNVVCHD